MAPIFGSHAKRGADEHYSLDAELYPVGDHKGRGEVKVKRYADGELRIEIDIRRLDAHERDGIFIRTRGVAIGPFVVSHKRIFEWVSSEDTPGLPDIQIGDHVEVLLNETPLLSGSFYPD